MKTLNIINDSKILDNYYSGIFNSAKDRRYILFDKEKIINNHLKKIDSSLTLKRIILGSFSELLKINDIIENYVQNKIKKIVIRKFKNETDYIDSYFSKRIDNNIILKKLNKDDKIKIDEYIQKQVCGVFSGVSSILYENSTISKFISEFFLNQDYFLKLKTCYYCNIDFVNVFDSQQYNHFTLDHVLPKSKFPYFSVSLFNLIPSCYSCNSKFKGRLEFTINDELNIICPSSNTAKISELIKFKMKFDVNDPEFENKLKSITEQNKLKIHLENTFSLNGIKEFLEIFKLESRYEFHKNVSYDLVDKRKIYSDSQIHEISNLLKRDEETVKKDIFGIECFESTNAPFEKYKQDIAEQLGLI